MIEFWKGKAMMDAATISTGYYDGPELVDTILAAARAAGLDPQQLDIDDLAELDEFHALGRAASVALAAEAEITRDSNVLDIGAGIGGPARLLASRYGARVTALDATARFCRANAALCAATGLADRVQVVHGDALALPFAKDSFDVVWSQALLQNVADKPRLLGEAWRVLRPGGRLALFELVGGQRSLHFPVPWADDESGSFVIGSDELRASVEQAGFDVITFNEGPAALAGIARAAEVLPSPAGNGLDLSLLMPDHETRMAAVGRNVAEGRIALVQVVAVKVG